MPAQLDDPQHVCGRHARVRPGPARIVALQRWEEVAEIALGLWLIASPFVYGYSGDTILTVWHVGSAASWWCSARFSCWQDWKLSDQDLASHP